MKRFLSKLANNGDNSSKEHLSDKKNIKYAFSLINKQSAFEYAYSTGQYDYCDTCLQYWMETIKPTSKEAQEACDAISMIAQPPMNTIIRDPVFVCYDGDRSYDTKKVYEKSYVEKVIEVNNTNCYIEEPSFAQVMTEEEHEKLKEGDEVITQLDTYDAVFMNTKLMTNGDVKKFIHSGAFRSCTENVEDVLPNGKSRRGHRGIHFVEMENENVDTEPLVFYSFEKFENFLFYQAIGKSIWSDKTFDEMCELHKSIYYEAATVTNNTVYFGFNFTLEDKLFIVKFAFSYISSLKNESKAIMVVTLKEANDPKPLLEFAYNILLFVAGCEDIPFSIYSEKISEDYNNETERIVRRAKVIETFITSEECICSVEENNKCYTVGNDIHTIYHNSISTVERQKFSNSMKIYNRSVLFRDKSYALKCTRIGLFTIPQTVYAPNQIRLSNGKRPKKIKRVAEYKLKKRKFTNFFEQKIKNVCKNKALLETYNVTEKKEVNKYENLQELKDVCLPLIITLELYKFHEIINQVDFQMKNKFIMAVRAEKDLPLSFNEIYMCIMNKEKCKQLMDKESVLDKWLNYFTSKTETSPIIETFNVFIDEIPVSDYVKKKMREKLSEDEISISPLVLACLLKFELSDELIQHGKNIQLTDLNFYPIHFVLHFCDDAEKRQDYTERLIRAEKKITGFSDLIQVYKKWQPETDERNCHCLFLALLEWPFHDLLRSIFLLKVGFLNAKKKIFNKRDSHETMHAMYMYLPGLGVLENVMQHYGFPEKYVESWSIGLKWFYDVGFGRTYELRREIKKKLRNQTVANFELKETMEALHDDYDENQLFERKSFETFNILRNTKDFTFENIFLNDEINIHHQISSNDYEEESLFELMLKDPIIWDDKDFLQHGKIMMYYLKKSPTLTKLFSYVSGVYIDLKLHQFASTYVEPASRHRSYPTRLNYVTLLARYGGSERQMLFLMNLQNPICQDFAKLCPKDVGQMLTDRTDPKIFKSTFLMNKYSMQERLFVVNFDQITTLLTDDTLFEDHGSARVDKKIYCISHFLDFYLKSFNKSVGNTMQDDYDELNLTFEQNQYLLALDKLGGVLIQILVILYKKSYLLKKPFASIFLAIVNCKYWKDTYIEDVLRFERKRLVSRSSLFSYACILLHDEIDLGKVWWRSWAFELLTMKELRNEPFRIFNSLLRTPVLRESSINTRILKDVVWFCNEYILKNLGDVNLCTSFKSSPANSKKSFHHLGECVLTYFKYNKNIVSICQSGLGPEVDKLMSKVVVSMHSENSMSSIYRGQNLWFLDEICPCIDSVCCTTPYEKFNAIVNIFLTNRLPNSLRLLFESFEKHFDYLNENQILDNFVKQKNIQHYDISSYLSHFRLNKKNFSELCSIHAKLNLAVDSKTEDMWCNVISKMLYMGIVDWNSFQLATDIDEMKPFHLMFQHHRQLTDFFYEQHEYHITYFAQKNLNPLTLLDYKCVNNPNLTWRQHVLKSCKKRGWPMKLYFPFNTTPIVHTEDIPIDNHFTINDGILHAAGFDYTDVRGQTTNEYNSVMNGERVIKEGKFVFEAQTMIAQTLLNFHRSIDCRQQKVTVKEFFSFINDFENFACEKDEVFWHIKHGIIKSEGETTFIHEKVDLVSLATLVCSDLTPLRLRKMYNTFDEKIKTFDTVIEAKKKMQIMHRIQLMNYICKHFASSFLFLLQFSDNIRYFDIAFKRLEQYCYRLNLPPTVLLLGEVLRVKTSHSVIGQSILQFYTHDILSFCVTYGRCAHVKYLVQFLADEIIKGYKLDNVYTRYDKASMKHPFHQLYFEADSCPYEHLLCCAIRKGHVKTFCHLIQFIPIGHLSNVKWKIVMQTCVHLVKFDAPTIDHCKQLLERKRCILKKILNMEKLKPFAKDLALGLNHCVKYLCGFKKKILKVSDYFTVFVPHFKGTLFKTKLLMRSELIVWGEHIYSTFEMFEMVTNECLAMTPEALLNCILFYSTNLLDFIIKRLDTSSGAFEAGIQAYKKTLQSNDNKFIEDLFENDIISHFKCILVHLLFKLESINKSLHVREIIDSGYLTYLWHNYLTGREIQNRNMAVFISLLAVQKFHLNGIHEHFNTLFGETLSNDCKLIQSLTEAKELEI